MILLPNQLLSLVYMLFAGWFYALFYAFYKRVFHCLERYKLSLLLDIVFQMVVCFIVYRGLYKINYGNFNIYLWLAFFIGIYLYISFYSLLFLSAFELLMEILNYIVRPLSIAYLKISAIIIRQRKGRRDKRWKKRLRKKQQHTKRKN